MVIDPLRILAIDPISHNLYTLKTAIEDISPQATVITAPGSAQGIALALTEAPDLIIVNVTTSELDGCKICSELKRDNRTDQIPILFLTTPQTDRESRLRALDAGAEAFLAWPVDDVELRAQIRAMTKIKSANRQTQQEQIRLAALEQELTRRLQSEREQAEKALEQFFEQPLNLHMIANMDGQILRANLGWERLLGYSREELEGRAFLDLVHPDDQAATVDEMANLKQGLTTFHFKNRYRHKNGDYRLLTWAAQSPHEDTQIYAIANDITEQAQAEKMLRRSEEQYRTILQTAMDGYWLADAQGRLLDVNQRYCQMSGYEEDELLAMSINDFEAIEAHNDVASHIEKVMTEGEDRFESQHRRKDGSIYDVEVSVQYKPMDGGRFVCFLRDITERKQAEEKLRQSEEEYRTILHTAMDGYLLINAQGQLVDTNERYCQMSGYSAEELLTLTISDLDANESTNEIVSHVHKIVVEGEDRFESQHRRKDGTIFDAEISAQYRSQGGGYMVVFLRDITERKQAEASLINERRRLAGIVEGTNVGTWEWNVQTGATIFNDRWAEIVGYRLEELAPINIDTWLRLVHPDDLEESASLLNRHFSGELPYYDFECRVRHKNGHWVWVHDRGRVISWTGDRQPFMMFGTHMDITQRKLAEKALRESEERFRAVVETAPDAIFIQTQHRFAYVNPAAVVLFDAVDATQLLGEMVTEHFHPDSRASVRERIHQVNEERQAVSRAIRKILRRDGTAVDVEVSAVPFIYEGHHGALVFASDITIRVRAETERTQFLARIQAQAQQITQIMDTVPEGVLLLDADGRVLLANPIGEEFLTALAGVGIGDKITRLGALPLINLLSLPNNGVRHEVRTHQRTFEVIARPIASDEVDAGNSGKGHWVLVIHEVTQERNIREQLQQQERLAAVGQLAAGIAHDFNNILAVIALHVPMLARSKVLTERDRERLTVIRDQTAHAARLIQQILDFSRRAVLERQPLDLGPFLKEQVKLITRTLPDEIHVTLDSEPGEYIVLADPTRVQQILMNLAVNARDAMPRGGALKLTLAHHTMAYRPDLPADPWVRLEVTDTGSGIAPEIQAHIFEPFFTTKGVGQGTGLGLAQVHGIVKQHNGEITVSSVMGQGSTFTIYLPAVPARVSEIEEEEDPQRGGGETILIVEDNEPLLTALTDIVETLGYSVIGVHNGVEALAVLEASGSSIALVLSDLSMPVMGGEALLTAMQTRGLTVPMIILSGYPLDSALAELKRNGLAGWLIKPPNIDELGQMLAQVLAK
jgi:PAS domain S-box-containing protein